MATEPTPAGHRYARVTLWLVLGWLALRVLYLRLWCPYELFGDEANFWEWTRHPALSYYSAGPGMLWLLWPFVRLLGPHEWALRLPAALSTAATALLLAGFARDVVGRDGARAGLVAAAACLLMPGYHLWSQIMTYDAPYTALWVAASWVGWRLLGRPGRGGAGLWALLGLCLGAGFLLKYATVLLIPALLGFAWLWRRHRAPLLPGALVAALVFAVCALPVVIWNARHGWHILTYLGAHLNAPGTHSHSGTYNPTWTPEFIGAQVLLAGLPGTALIIWSLVAAARLRRSEPETWRGLAFALWCGATPLLFFLAVTAFTRSQANWALPGFAPLLVPLAWLVVRGWERAAVRHLWWGYVAYGVLLAGLVSLPQVAARLPGVGHLVPTQRFAGHSRLAAQVEGQMRALRAETGHEAFIVGSNYDQASLMAFYVAGHPATYAAASYLGWRKNSYDFWPEADLASPALRGRPAIMLGGEPGKWRAAFRFARWQEVDRGFLVGYDYGGPTGPPHPSEQ
jgi:4-amino-4-deoxy-L-arabinose transferase-like glycosyltransferase